jgi:hypothetical protein
MCSKRWVTEARGGWVLLRQVLSRGQCVHANVTGITSTRLGAIFAYSLTLKQAVYRFVAGERSIGCLGFTRTSWGTVPMELGSVIFVIRSGNPGTAQGNHTSLLLL